MSSKRATFLPSAEELVAAKPDYVPPTEVAQTDPELARLDAEEADRRRVMESTYKARNRAKTLLSMEVQRAASPSERLTIKTPEGHPYGLRWCDTEYRKKMGMDIWSAVTPEEYDDIKQFVNADQVKVEDGQIKSGDLFLAKAPRAKLDARDGLHYQRSQRALQQSVAGKQPLQNRSGSGEGQRAVPAGPTMGDLEGRSDEVQYTGTLKDDSLAGY